MSNCTNCATLQAEITRLRLEIAALERVIEAARGECVTLVNEATQTQASHVPRGIWAHAEGKRDAAGRVWKRLGH